MKVNWKLLATATTICAALMLAAPAFGQIGPPPSAIRIIGRITVPISNTGNTGTNTYLTGSAIRIPGGTMGLNSVLRITAYFARTSGTGNCTGSIRIATSVGADNGIIGNQLTANSNIAAVRTIVANTNSLTAQTIEYDSAVGGGTVTPAYGTGGLNTASDFYVNAFQNNTVSTDNCSLVNEIVELIP